MSLYKMSGRVSCGRVVVGRIEPMSDRKLQIGSLTWPSEVPNNGTTTAVLKTAADGSLTFEPSNVRVVVDAKAKHYDIQDHDDIVAITGTLDTTLRLPDPKTKIVGDLIYIVKEVPGTSTVTVVPHDKEHISGKSSVKMFASYGSFKLYSNGTNYFALF